MTAKLLTAPEVADLLGIELDTLYRYARRGEIRGVKIGKLWRFATADVDGFIAARRTRGGTPRPQTLVDALRQAAGADSGGVVVEGRRAAFAEIDGRSDAFATALAEAGVRPGDRVALFLPNSVEFVIAVFAAWKAGAILVADDSAIRPTNLRHILSDASPRALIADRNVLATLETMVEALPRPLAIFADDGAFALGAADEVRVHELTPALAPRPDTVARPVLSRPADVVSITYTSGSTGLPKGVAHTNESWLASAEFTRDHAGLTAADQMFIPLPLHHAYAFRQVLAYMLARGTVRVADLYQSLRLMKSERPTALLLVPAACNIVLDHFGPLLSAADAYLRYVEIGSAALPPERLARLRELLPTTEIHLPYGLTEARVGFLKAGSDGLLNRITDVSPGLEVRLLDGAGLDVPPGETGEIVLRGRGLMQGYWGRAGAVRPEGFRTGDMGRRDLDGRIVLLGRVDDMLKIGGRKVNPSEVEMALNRHPAVLECAAVAVADPRGLLELVLYAYVALRKDASVTEQELLAHCRKQLEPYKVPERIVFRAALPKSPVGKILRKALQAEPSDLVLSTLGE